MARKYKVYISNKPIDKKKSRNPLVWLSYRQLQALAADLELPIEAQHKVLLALIIARTTHREDLVAAIIQQLVPKKAPEEDLAAFETSFSSTDSNFGVLGDFSAFYSQYLGEGQ